MVLETIGAAGVIFKAKYIKRTGGPGNYKYWYRNPKTGKLQAGKQPAKKPKGSQGVVGPSNTMNPPTTKYAKKLTEFENSVDDYRDMLSEVRADEAVDAYKEFDKTEKVAYEKMNNEISRARKQRDRKLNMAKDKYLQLSEKISSIYTEPSGNVEDLDGPMEELEKVGSDIDAWKRNRDFLAKIRPED